MTRVVIATFLLGGVALPGTTVITSIQSTQTQAVIRVNTDQAGACAYRVSENSSFTPLDHDVDPTLFAGLNLDSRPGSIILGSQHIFVAGKRSADVASDGKRYSRALQANTVHWVGVTCGGDSETVASFQTENPPLGRAVPEPAPFDPTAFGNYAWPTIDFTDQSKTYVDPMTGLLIKRITSSGWRGKQYQNNTFARAFDLNSAWTAPNSLLTWPGAGAVASYAGTASDPIFAAVDLSTIPDYGYGALTIGGWTPGNTIDDVLLRTYGSGNNVTAANRTILACLSNDSGNTCDTPEISVVLPLTTGIGPTAPASGFPQPSWTSWSPTLPYHGHDWGTVLTTVTTSGTTITNTGTQSSQYFNRAWKPGGKILVNGAETYTIASVANGSTITTVETMTAHSTPVPFKSLTSGVRMRKQTATGAITLSVGFDVAQGTEFNMPFTGARLLCSTVPVTVTHDATGATAPARSANLCVAPEQSGGNTLFAFFADTGESRLLSHFESTAGYQYHPPDWSQYDGNNPIAGYYSGGNVWDPTVGTRFYTEMRLGTHAVLVQVNYTGNFASYVPGYFISGWPADSLTYTVFGFPSQNQSVDQLVAAFGNPVFDPTQYTVYTFLGLMDNGKVMWEIQTPCCNENQAFFAIQDVVSGAITAVVDTRTNYPLRFWGNHSSVNDTGRVGISSNIPGNKGASTANYLGGPWILSPTALYKNGAWTSDTSLTATYVDPCPATVAPQWQALGATGNNCVQIRTLQPCSPNAGPAELAKFPCPWDNTKSMLTTLAPGDRFWVGTNCNGSCSGGSAETMRVVTTPMASGNPNEVQFYALRFSENYGNIGGTYGGTGYTHPTGWVAAMIPPEARTSAFAWIDSTGTVLPDLSTISGTHADIGAGYTPGNYTTVAAGNTAINQDFYNYYGVRFDHPFASQVDNAADLNIYVEGKFAGVDYGGLAYESYISMHQIKGPANEQRWFLDLHHISPSGGVGQEVYSQIGNMTASLLAGTTGVFKFTAYSGLNTNIKIAPAFANAGRYLLHDVSSPTTGNLVTDATPWAYCFVYTANECRTGSAVGQVYMTVPQADLGGVTAGQCIGGFYASTDPCAWISSPAQVWAVQIDGSRSPIDNNYWRKLTLGFAGPLRQYQFGNLIPTPDATWAFMQGYWLDGARNELIALKLPAFPNYDSVNRADFVPVPAEVPAGPGTSARVRFGYAENGPPSSFFCSSRQEACVTDMSVTPFAFAQSDTLSPTFCASGCTINVPGLSGRVVYYVTERLNASGAVVQRGDMQAVVVP